MDGYWMGHLFPLVNAVFFSRSFILSHLMTACKGTTGIVEYTQSFKKKVLVVDDTNRESPSGSSQVTLGLKFRCDRAMLIVAALVIHPKASLSLSL